MSADIIELLHTTPAPHMTIDPVRAMADGRRDRLRRRLVIGAAAAVVLAMVVAGSQVMARDRAVPAIPAPGQLSIIPGPTGAAPDYRIAADLVSSARRVEVTIEDADGRDLTRRTIALTTDADLGFTEIEGLPGGPLIVYVGPRDSPSQFIPSIMVMDGWTAFRELPGSALGAYARPLTAGSTAADRVQFASLKDRGGVFSDGSHVATAHFGDVVYWVNREHRVRGNEGPDGSSGSAIDPTDPIEPPYLKDGGAAQVGEGTDAFTRHVAFGVLPAGATDVSVAVSGSDATGVTIRSASLDDGSGVAVYLTRTVPLDAPETDPWATVTGVRWTDTQGVEHRTPLS